MTIEPLGPTLHPCGSPGCEQPAYYVVAYSVVSQPIFVCQEHETWGREQADAHPEPLGVEELHE